MHEALWSWRPHPHLLVKGGPLDKYKGKPKKKWTTRGAGADAEGGDDGLQGKLGVSRVIRELFDTDTGSHVHVL